MEIDKPKEKMKQEIKEIFQNVNEWLKFAEAKHAGLIVLNSGLIFGILSIYKDYKTIIDWHLILVIIIVIGISIILSLISLFPITKNETKNKQVNVTPNLYFFGSLSKLSEIELKSELLKSNPNYQFDRFEEDLINQIVVNAIIATRKYKLFKFAIWFTTVGLVLPVITLIIKLIWH